MNTAMKHEIQNVFSVDSTEIGDQESLKMYLTGTTTAASEDLSPNRQLTRGGSRQVPLSQLVPGYGKYASYMNSNAFVNGILKSNTFYWEKENF